MTTLSTSSPVLEDQRAEDRRLFVAEKVAPGRFLLRHGQPVWPCTTPALLEAVTSALEGQGVGLERVTVDEAEPIEAPLSEADGVVVALGNENLKLARLHAFLTGRSARAIDRISELADVSGAEVLLAKWQQLGVDEYDALYVGSSTRRPIGILTGLDDDDLHRRVLISSALTHLSRSDLAALPSHAVFGNRAPESTLSLFDRVTKPNAEPEKVAELMREPSALLGFVGHSDGVDAGLSAKAVLCSRVDPDVVDLHLRPANCDLTGYCHRRHLVRSDALASGALLSPRQVSTRLFLMLSCYVARPMDGSVHPKHGLLAQLTSNARVGAIVAPWEIAYSSPKDLISMVKPLLAGETIGGALAWHYRAGTGAQRGCNRYLLFGDPGIRAVTVRKRASDKPSLATRLRRALTARPRAQAKPPATNLRAWLDGRLARIAREPKLKANGDLRVTKERLAKARLALRQLASTSSRAGAYRELLDVIVSFEGSTFVHWLEDSLGLPRFIDRETRCFGCDQPGRLFHVDYRHGSRWLACCARCDSFYADVPAGSELIDAQFEVGPDWSVRHELPEMPHGVIAVNFRSALETRTTWFLGEAFDAPTLPPGRSWVWLHALNDLGMMSYSRMIDNRPHKERHSDDQR